MIHFLSDPLVRTIYDYVVEIHSHQRYRGLSYEKGHLLEVARVYEEAGLSSRDDFLIAICHDSIDDCGPERRAEVTAFMSKHLSDFSFGVVWAMSAVGRNRVERNQDWMGRIETNPEAAKYKVGDRIINFASPEKRSMYQKEHEEFSRRIVSLCKNQHLVDRYMEIARQ